MALFTGIGDFFRGAFGESDEEKKRRKAREAQQAAQRQAAQPPKPPIQNVTQLFGQNQPDSVQPPKPTPVVSPVVRPPELKIDRPPLPVAKPVVSQLATGGLEVPATATKTYHDQHGGVVGWEDAQGSHLTRYGQAQRQPTTPAAPPNLAERAVSAITQPFRETGDQLVRQAQYLTGKTRTQAGEPGAQQIINDQQEAARRADYVRLRQTYKNIGAADAAQANRMAAQGAKIADIKAYLDRAAAALDKQNKKMAGDAAQIASTGMFGGEIPASIAAATGKQGLRALAASKSSLTDILSGIIGNIGATISDKPDASAKDVATAGAVGGALGEAGFFLPRGLRRLFGGGKAAPEPVVPTSTVVDSGLVKPWYEAAQQPTVEDMRIARELGENPQFGKKEVSPAEVQQRRQDSERRAAANDPLNTPTIVRQGKEAYDQATRDFILRNGVIDDAEYAQRRAGILAQISKEEAQVRSGLIKIRTQQELEAFQKRHQDLLDGLDLHKRLSDEVVANAQRNAAADAERRTATNGQVKEAQAAATNPAPAGAATTAQPTAPTAPEVVANDAYRPSTEELLFGNTPSFTERDGLSLGQKLSADRALRENVTNPAENLVNRGVAGLQTSDNRAARGLGRLFQGFTREAGVAPELQAAKMQLRGGVETGKLQREAIADLSKGMSPDSTNRVWATLDPEQASRLGITADNLTPEETVLRDKLKTVIDNVTNENLRRGLITPEQAANDSYLKRAYTVYDGNPEASKFEGGFRQELLGQYKGRKQVSDEMVQTAITDPTYLAGKKTAESNAIWAMQDYGNFLSREGHAVETPRPGYVQLPATPVFGDAAGKYVPQGIAEDFTGFQYQNAFVSAFNDLITAYDRLGIRQAKKQLLTIFNPAVRLGNQATNRVIFSQLAGINPVRFNLAYRQAGQQIAQRGQLYREAVQQGLTGVDISQAEFFAQRIGQSAGGDKNLFKKSFEWAQKSYSGADDQARVAAYMVKRQQGYDPVEAARQVQRGFQDYKSVGFFYDMAAKTPLLGNAFVRFAADSVRIAKNAALDHPLRTLGTVAAWSAFVNGMSVLSGESELEGANPMTQAFNLISGQSKSDQQRNRESRFGAPKLPFTDISTAVQTPWGEVNVARFMPWYQLNDIQDSGIQKFLPFQQAPLTRDANGKLAIDGSGFQDPLLGQVVQLAADKDFRNKSIRDPQDNGQFPTDPLNPTARLGNALRFLFANNAPLGKEFDQTASALQNKPDLYGKERSVPQALLRDFGLKIEEQGSKQAQERASQQAYFAEKAQIDDQLKGLDPASQEAYKRLTGYYKLHEQVANEFAPGETRNKKAAVYEFPEDKWKEYAAHPELYQLMVDKKVRESQVPNDKGIKRPLQPEFDPRLSEAFRKQLIQNKMVAPGDDAELDQRMYSSPEWDYYQSLKDKYREASKQYYHQTDSDTFDDETVKHTDAKFPDKPAVLKQYSAAYGLYADGKADKPEFTDAVKAAREQYNHQTLDWTNKERAARGLPAITWDVWNNPTFGFNAAEGSGGYNPADHVNTLGRLTSFSNSIERLDPVTAAAMPALQQLFTKLKAGGGAGKAKAKLGASSSGR